MTKYLCNSISAQMLLDIAKGRLSWVFIDEQMFRFLSQGAESYMGHRDLAEDLGVEYNRKPVYLQKGDMLYVAQVCNGRGTDKEEVKYIQFYVEE